MTSVACETDNVDPLDTEIGKLTFQVEVTQDAPIIAAKSQGCGHAFGKDSATPNAPTMMTTPTYDRTPRGRPRQPNGSAGVDVRTLGGIHALSRASRRGEGAAVMLP